MFVTAEKEGRMFKIVFLSSFCQLSKIYTYQVKWHLIVSSKMIANVLVGI